MKILLTVALGFASTVAQAGNGDISIINRGDSPVVIEAAHSEDFSNTKTATIVECRFRDPFSNLSGMCSGANGFSSGDKEELFIRFRSHSEGTFVHSYRLAPGCYQLVWHPLGYGFDLHPGC